MTVQIKDELVASMLPSIRDTFHLTLMPRDKRPSPVPDSVGASMLGATLMQAEIIATRLNIPADVPGILGTTTAVIDGLRSHFNDPKPEKATALIQAQKAHNTVIDATHPTVQAIAPYLTTIVPPTERRAERGFGY